LLHLSVLFLSWWATWVLLRKSCTSYKISGLI
jgi:hypothetical protein